MLNYYHLLRAEWWWPAAIAGLFCIRPILARRRVMTLAGLLALPIFALRDLDPFFRAGIPLLLPGAWGLGALLDAGMRAAYETGAGRHRATVLAALVVLLPLGLEMGRTSGSLWVGFSLPIDWGLISGPEQRAARDAADFVNARVEPADVVVVSPHVAWLYRGQVADFLQGVAAGGEAVAFYPAGLPARRFRFDPSADRVLGPLPGWGPDAPGDAGPPGPHPGSGVRYAVLDPYWDRWARESGPVARYAAAVETWPREWVAGNVRVHRRPAP
jgi:hypothetical protein